jgi:hypothetical protein
VGWWSWMAGVLDRRRREASVARRFRALTAEERRAVLSASDYEFLWVQGMEGDGWIARKNEPDIQRALERGLGTTHVSKADDVIIQHYLRSQEDL